ncbi:MAG: YjbQ family protein [Candidatus Zixiibacteriota bacterium]|nr:MAG: YjbQ family protein [candidate division Zixibacteria bacterium]
MLEFEVATRQNCELVAVDHLLQEALRRCGLREGVLMVFSPHTTAGLTINENADPDVQHDLLASLDRQVPRDEHYRHREGNSAAHIKTALVGTSVTVPVTGARLKLGTWQSVFFAEFDGPRRRRLWIMPIFSQPHSSSDL